MSCGLCNQVSTTCHPIVINELTLGESWSLKRNKKYSRQDLPFRIIIRKCRATIILCFLCPLHLGLFVFELPHCAFCLISEQPQPFENRQGVDYRKEGAWRAAGNPDARASSQKLGCRSGFDHSGLQ